MPRTPNDQVEEVKAQEAEADSSVPNPSVSFEPPAGFPAEHLTDEEIAAERFAVDPEDAATDEEKARILAIIDEMRPIFRAPDQISLLDELVSRINA